MFFYSDISLNCKKIIMYFVFDRKKIGFSFSVLIIVLLSISFGTTNLSAKSNGVEKTFSTESRNVQTAQIAASPIFEQFNEWLEIYVKNNFAADGRQLRIGENLAQERAGQFKQLAAVSPEIALSKAVSPETFRRLPDSITQYLEKPVSFYGDFLVYTIDEIDRPNQHGSSRTAREVVIGEARYRALVYGRRLTMTTKMDIPLSGVIIGDTIVVDENPARPVKSAEIGDAESALGGEEAAAEIGGKLIRFANEAELQDFIRQQTEWEATIGPARSANDSAASAQTSDAPASSWTEGAKTILVIRVDFSDKPGEPLDHYNQPLTESRAQTLFNTTVNNFYQANSYNKTSLQATVTPVVRLPQTVAFYAEGTNYSRMLTDARASARAAGYETNSYALDVIAFGYTPSIGWAGLASVGGKSAWLNGAFYLTETAHEIGHNFGLMHANLWRTADGNPIGAGSNVEYGDCYDTMGACPSGNSNRHFNARYKRQLDWLTEADVQTVTSTGNYRIYAQDSAGGGIRALKINKDSTKSYWVEFRQLTAGNALNGALVRWDYANQNFRETQLLDMTPSTSTTGDAPLLVGQSFYDAASQIRITVLGKGNTSPESLDLRVELNNQSSECSYSLSAAGASIQASGGTGSLNVTAPANCGWTAASNQSFVSVTSGSSGSGTGTISYYVGQNASGSARTATITIAGQAFTVTQYGANISTAPRSVLYDFDGDGRADVSVYRPTDGTWYLSNSREGFAGIAFGLPTDKPVAADYDGDGKTDAAVYRDGNWYLQRTSYGFAGINFGLPTDIPAPADYDGDGRAEIAVFRPSNGTWYFYNLANNAFSAEQFGMYGDKPTAADFDGDGKADIAVYRPSDGTWYLQRSQLGFTAVRFGAADDTPVAADYDGDRKADVAVFRQGDWYFLNSSNGQFGGVNWGIAADKPVPADYDGDGKADPAVYRGGTWHILQSAEGYKAAGFGLDSDLPVPASQQ